MVVTMAPKGPLHESALQRLTRIFVRGFDGRATVRIGGPFCRVRRLRARAGFLALVPLGELRLGSPFAGALAHRGRALVAVVRSRDEGKALRGVRRSGILDFDVADGIVEVHVDIVRGAYARHHAVPAG